LRRVPRRVLHTGAAAAVRAHLPWHRLRVPLPRQSDALVLGLGLLCRVDGRRVRAGRSDRRDDAGDPGGERTIRGRRVRLAGIVTGARRKHDLLPFAMTVVFFLASFLTLGVMFWPYMIPYSITVASAAAPQASLQFLFYGGVVVLPVIAVYTIGVYWIFRG